MAVANTLAYYDTAEITAVKCCHYDNSYNDWTYNDSTYTMTLL